MCEIYQQWLADASGDIHTDGRALFHKHLQYAASVLPSASYALNDKHVETYHLFISFPTICPTFFQPGYLFSIA